MAFPFFFCGPYVVRVFIVVLVQTIRRTHPGATVCEGKMDLGCEKFPIPIFAMHLLHTSHDLSAKSRDHPEPPAHLVRLLHLGAPKRKSTQKYSFSYMFTPTNRTPSVEPITFVDARWTIPKITRNRTWSPARHTSNLRPEFFSRNLNLVCLYSILRK